MSQSKLSRRSAFVMCMALAAGNLFAQTAFPQRPIKLVVPYGAGSSVDLVSRLYAQRLSALVGQAVIVENKAGAGTMLGTSAAAHAPADGYTLLIGSNALAIMPHLYKTDFESLNDFVPVAPLYNTAIVLVAKPSFAANNLTELVAMAKKQPGKLSYSTWGVGGSAHLVMELLRDKADIDLLHVPYKGGGAESAAAVMAGDVDVGFDVVYTALPRIRSGQLKAIGAFYPERVEGLPNVQTAAEAGYPEAGLYGWVGVFAPARTPVPALQKLGAASQEILRDPAFSGRLRELGSKAFVASSEVLMDTLRSESERVQRIVSKRKIKVE